MPSSPFVGEWTIEDWSHDTVEVSGGIPTGAFLLNGSLNITQPTPNVNSFSLQWPSQDQKTSSVSGLQANEEQTELSGHSLPVDFGLSKPVTCDLTITLTHLPEGKQLNGTIHLQPSLIGHELITQFRGPEIGNGTFTATTNAGGAGAARKP
jgi:hypothetical protein